MEKQDSRVLRVHKVLEDYRACQDCPELRDTEVSLDWMDQRESKELLEKRVHKAALDILVLLVQW